VFGQAQDVGVARSSHWFWGGQQVTTLSFRSAVYGSDGRLRGLLSVSMDGQKLEGRVRNGDWVRVWGSMKNGTLEARRLEVVNPDGSRVSVDGGQSAVITVGHVLGAIVLAAIVVFVLTAILVSVISNWDSIVGDGAPCVPVQARPVLSSACSLALSA
jgi:hypothetical protein